MDVTQLPLVGAHPALDLVNTVERGRPVGGAPPRDFLRSTSDVLTWAVRAGVLDGAAAAAEVGAAGAGGEALERLRTLREALHLVVLAQLGEIGWDGAAGSALAELGRAQAEAGARSRLDLVAGRPRRKVGGDPLHRIEDLLADAATELLTGPLATRIKRCPIARGGCGWVFVDGSRNSSRTWCRMADCGNQVKARRLTERRRRERTDPATGEGR